MHYLKMYENAEVRQLKTNYRSCCTSCNADTFVVPPYNMDADPHFKLELFALNRISSFFCRYGSGNLIRIP